MIRLGLIGVAVGLGKGVVVSISLRMYRAIRLRTYRAIYRITGQPRRKPPAGGDAA